MMPRTNATTTDVWSVGEVATMSGVTVRTLHHYEQIGLLVPGRSHSGYRQYETADLDRLTRILYYRELGFALPEIAEVLDDPALDGTAHLQQHRAMVQQKVNRLNALLAAIDKELEATTMGTELSPAEKLEIFGEGYDPAWETEAEQRWGDSDAWKVSQQRTKKFTKDDWKRIKAEGEAFMQRLANAKNRGVTPDSDEAAELAEEHRVSIETFYPCSHAQQRGLADLYVSDPRFTKTYDDVTPGLAQWLNEAIHANADRHGAPPASEADWSSAQS